MTFSDSSTPKQGSRFRRAERSASYSRRRLRRPARWTSPGIIQKEIAENLQLFKKDQRHGYARGGIIEYLTRLKSPAVGPTALALLDDYTAAVSAITPVKKLRMLEALPALDRLLSDDRDWVRKKAKNAIVSIHAWHAKRGQHHC